MSKLFGVLKRAGGGGLVVVAVLASFVVFSPLSGADPGSPEFTVDVHAVDANGARTALRVGQAARIVVILVCEGVPEWAGYDISFSSSLDSIVYGVGSTWVPGSGAVWDFEPNQLTPGAGTAKVDLQATPNEDTACGAPGTKVSFQADIPVYSWDVNQDVSLEPVPFYVGHPMVIQLETTFAEGPRGPVPGTVTLHHLDDDFVSFDLETQPVSADGVNTFSFVPPSPGNYRFYGSFSGGQVTDGPLLSNGGSNQLIATRADDLTVDAGTSRALVSAETYVGDTVSISLENLRCGYMPYTGEVEVSDGDAASVEGEVMYGSGWVPFTAANEGQFTPVITFSDGVCAGLDVTLAPYRVLTNDVTLLLRGPSDPVVEGDTYTMVATVAAVAGTRIPQGEVTFINDQGRFTARLDANGVATFDAVAPNFPASAGGTAATASTVVGAVPWGADFVSSNGLTGVVFGPQHSIDIQVIAGPTPPVAPLVTPKPPSSAPQLVRAAPVGPAAPAVPGVMTPVGPSGVAGRHGGGHSANTGASPKLARTGSSSGMLVSSGFGLVVAGAVLLVLRRRRCGTVA